MMAPSPRPGPTSRLTLSGAFLGMAITAALFAHLFSAYWLILAGAALLGFTQSWSFDLARIEQQQRHHGSPGEGRNFGGDIARTPARRR